MRMRMGSMDDKQRKAMFARMGDPRSMRFSNGKDSGVKVFEQVIKTKDTSKDDVGLDSKKEDTKQSTLTDNKSKDETEKIVDDIVKEEKVEDIPKVEVKEEVVPTDAITVSQVPTEFIVGESTVLKDAKGKEREGPPREDAYATPVVTSYEVDTTTLPEETIDIAKIKKPVFYADDGKKISVTYDQPKQKYDKYGELEFETVPVESYTRLDFIPESAPMEKKTTKQWLDEKLTRMRDVQSEIATINDNPFYDDVSRNAKLKELAAEAKILDRDIKILDVVHRNESMQTISGAAEYGAEKGVEAAKERIREMTTKGIAALPGEAVAYVGEVARTPSRVVRGGIDVGKRVVGGTVNIITNEGLVRAIEPAAATAGAAVSGLIGETRDIFNLPKQEFWTPPGYQRVWTGERYAVLPVDRYPMEPWAVTKGMGIGMPPGVKPSSPQEVALMAADVYTPWGGVVPKEYVESPRDMWEVPKIAVPKISMPQTMMWIVPPAEVLYGVQQQAPGRTVVQTQGRTMVQGRPVIVRPRVAVPAQRSVTKTTVQVTQPQAKIPSRIVYPAVRSMPKLPRLPTITAKRKTTGVTIPSSVTRVISERQKLENLKSSPGYNEPAIRKTEASLQSKTDYALRHNEPGTVGRYMLEAGAS